MGRRGAFFVFRGSGERIDPYVGKEHKTRGHHAEDAWHAPQAEGWRLAAEDTVMTETERERSEHRTIMDQGSWDEERVMCLS